VSPAISSASVAGDLVAKNASKAAVLRGNVVGSGKLPLSLLEAKLRKEIPPEQSAVPSTPNTVVPEQIVLAEGKVPVLPELTLEFSEIWQEVKINAIISRFRFFIKTISAGIKKKFRLLNLIFIDKVCT
jgi:hypothetical protein